VAVQVRVGLTLAQRLASASSSVVQGVSVVADSSLGSWELRFTGLTQLAMRGSRIRAVSGASVSCRCEAARWLCTVGHMGARTSLRFHALHRLKPWMPLRCRGCGAVSLENVEVERISTSIPVFSLEAPIVRLRGFSCGLCTGRPLCLDVIPQSTTLQLSIESSAFYNNSNGAVRVSGTTLSTLAMEVRNSSFLANMDISAGVLDIAASVSRVRRVR
jgi:hypothetical protein